jgi:hypothetical protein
MKFLMLLVMLLTELFIVIFILLIISSARFQYWFNYKRKKKALFRYPQNIPISFYLNGSFNKQSVL